MAVMLPALIAAYFELPAIVQILRARAFAQVLKPIVRLVAVYVINFSRPISVLMSPDQAVNHKKPSVDVNAKITRFTDRAHYFTQTLRVLMGRNASRQIPGLRVVVEEPSDFFNGKQISF